MPAFGLRFPQTFALTLLCAVSLLSNAHSNAVILTLQAQSQNDLNGLFWNGVQGENQDRHLLSLDATASGVVDLQAPYLVTDVQSMPTLSLLNAASFDENLAQWNFEYETMAVDSSVPGQLNQYDRILYFTKGSEDSEPEVVP